MSTNPINVPPDSLVLMPAAESEHSKPVDLDVLMAFEDLQDENEPDLIVELIDLYLDDLPKCVAEITKTMAANEWILVKRAAHRLKGSSANLGIRKVSELCERLERIGQEVLPHQTVQVTRELTAAAAEATAVLLAIRQGRIV